MQRRSLLLAASAAVAYPFIGHSASAQEARLLGAGDPVPRLVLNAWGQAGRQEIGLPLAYEALNSVEGVAKVSDRTVDFAVSGAALSPARLKEKALLQFPFVASAVAPCVNLPGVQDNQLRLTPDVLAAIFLGRITKWNDPKIVEHNPGKALPDLAITPVTRSEAASPTLVFTTYLSRVSEAWRGGPRAGTTVAWPVGTAALGVDGVVKAVKATPGAITYLGTANALTAGLARTQLQNHERVFVKPELATYAAAEAAADWTVPGFAADLVDMHAAGAWPIIAPSFALVPTNPAADRVLATLAALRLFDWGFAKGSAEASKLDYVPLPDAVARSVRDMWSAVKGPDGKPIWGA